MYATLTPLPPRLTEDMSTSVSLPPLRLMDDGNVSSPEPSFLNGSILEELGYLSEEQIEALAECLGALSG